MAIPGEEFDLANRIRPPVLYQTGNGKPTPGHPGAGRVFERPPVFGYDLIVQTIAAEWTGGGVSASFPQTARILQGPAFDVDIGLVGLILVCSLVNDQANTRFGVWAALDVGEQLALNGGNRVFLGAVTQQNSQAGGVPNPSSKTASISFGENSAVRMNSGNRISLYGGGSNVGQLGAATLTILSIQLNRGQNG